MKKIIFLGVIICLNVMFSSAEVLNSDTLAVEESEYFKLMGKADEAIEKGQWDEAESYLLTALRAEPANPSNYLLMSNLGIVRFQMGQDSLAVMTLNDAHFIAPASVTVLSNRARVLNALGRIDDAYSDYSMILRLDSLEIEPRFYRGMIALQKNNFITAQADFEKLESLVPESRYTSIGCASFYSAVGDYRKAVKYYTKLLKDDPVVEYYSVRAACYLMLQQYSDASADISEGLKLDPNDAELYLYRAYLNKQLYQMDEAEADVKKALELGADIERVKIIFNAK